MNPLPRFSRRAASVFLAAAFLLPAALHTGCEGGSTGVDNPGLARLPVEFRNAAGDAVLVRGDLEIYVGDHNPAVDSAPLLRLPLESDAGIELTAADFERALAVRPPKRSAGTKRAAAAAPNASDSLIRFNLVFRDASGSGALAVGPGYDPVLKRFAAHGGAAPGVRMLPRSLLRFAASLHREAIHGDLGRIILPGTPFQATLVDSGFVLEGLPEGRFPMRLLDGDGFLYAVRESLDTRAGHAFTAAPEPIGRIAAGDPPPGFGVKTEQTLTAEAGLDTPLNGALIGVDSGDTRVSILWRFLEKMPGDSAFIAEPTRLRTRLRLPAPGGYRLELAASLGGATVRDTLQIKVAAPPAVTPAKFIYPAPGDTLLQGQPTKVAWEYPATGQVRLQFSYKENPGGEWTTIADSLHSATVQATYAWTAPEPGPSVYDCFLRLVAIPSDTVLATSSPFFLKPR